MKNLIALLLVAGTLVACDNNGNGKQDPADSIEARTDSLKENVDSAFETKIDSLQERKEELKENFDSAGKKRIDSLKKKQ